MASLGNEFNAESIKPQDDFEPIPTGIYRAMITDSDVKKNKASTGTYLALACQVLEGPFTRRLVWGNITLTNPNATAQEIGQRQLSSLCHAVGKLRIRDSQELHNIPLEIRVIYVQAGVDKTGTHREARNEIKAFKAIGESSSPVTQPTSAAPDAKVAKTAPPWAKKAG